MMDYIDLKKAFDDIKSKNEKVFSDMRKATKGKSKADAIRACCRTMAVHLKDCILRNDSLKYKDKNYSHEKEIRGQIEFEAINEEEHDNLYLLDCDFGNLTDLLWLSVNEDFVEEICFDARCPEYKTKIYKELIDPESKLVFVESEAFGAVF